MSTTDDRQIIQDFADHFVGDRVWITGAAPTKNGQGINPDGLGLVVEGWDEDGNNGFYEVNADTLRQAIATALNNYFYLCCAESVREGGIGMGCADDWDTIIQTAIYGEPVFA